MHLPRSCNPFSAVLYNSTANTVGKCKYYCHPPNTKVCGSMTIEGMLTHARSWYPPTSSDQGNTVQPHTPRQLAAWKENAKQEGAAKVREFQVWCSAWESPELSWENRGECQRLDMAGTLRSPLSKNCGASLFRFFKQQFLHISSLHALHLKYVTITLCFCNAVGTWKSRSWVSEGRLDLMS